MSNLVVQKLLAADRIAVFTGAGISAESGVPTYRDKTTGVWSNYDPYEFSSVDGWNTNKQRVWAWYETMRAKVMWALPNEAHLVIAGLQNILQEKTGRPVEVSVITQNIDDLHERAGSTDVLHLHGSLFAPRCSACEMSAPLSHGLIDEESTAAEPPPCAECGESVRPGVVWFGESLPRKELKYAKMIARDCDVMLVVGTSGTVYPAAAIPYEAQAQNRFVCSINPHFEKKERIFAHYWEATAVDAFQEILNALENVKI